MRKVKVSKAKKEVSLWPEPSKMLYTALLRCRMFEEKIVELYPQQEMRCPTHLSIGQEAVAAGVCGALRKDDLIFSTHDGEINMPEINAEGGFSDYVPIDAPLPPFSLYVLRLR